MKRVQRSRVLYELCGR